MTHFKVEEAAEEAAEKAADPKRPESVVAADEPAEAVEKTEE